MPILPLVQKIECIETRLLDLVTLKVKSRSPKAIDLSRSFNDGQFLCQAGQHLVIWLINTDNVYS